MNVFNITTIIYMLDDIIDLKSFIKIAGKFSHEKKHKCEHCGKEVEFKIPSIVKDDFDGEYSFALSAEKCSCNELYIRFFPKKPKTKKDRKQILKVLRMKMFACTNKDKFYTHH